MGRTGYQEKYIKMIGEYTTNHYTCNNCPAKLFNDTDYIRKGVGNINSAKMIILPTYISINKKLFDEIIDMIVDRYRIKYYVHALEAIYITPVIKCFCNTTKYDINNIILEKCAVKTKSELANHKCHTTLIYLGDAQQINIIMPQHLHKVSISCPYMIFDDDKEKEMFLDELFKIL